MSNKKKHRNRARRLIALSNPKPESWIEKKWNQKDFSIDTNQSFGKLGFNPMRSEKSESERLQAVKDYTYYLKGFQK